MPCTLHDMMRMVSGAFGGKRPATTSRAGAVQRLYCAIPRAMTIAAPSTARIRESHINYCEQRESARYRSALDRRT